ncbi:putative DNA-directed RNA polymerase subunit M, partial [Pseudoloma neurophilia]
IALLSSNYCVKVIKNRIKKFNMKGITSSSLFNFCPICQSILLLTHSNNNSNILKCKNCNYFDDIALIKSEIFFKRKQTEQIVRKQSLASCHKQCDRCNNSMAYFHEMQTRSADEPMTIFYQCCRCQFMWKE